VNHQLESRMRENRTYGSEGGGAGNSTGSSYPYPITRSSLQRDHVYRGNATSTGWIWAL